MSISENLSAVQERVRLAAAGAGVDEKSIRIIGATKMNDASRVREAIGAGLGFCGERR